MVNRNYRVEAECLKCGRVWITRPKNNQQAPHRCHKNSKGEGCGSTQTKKLTVYRRNEKPEQPDWVKQ